MNVSNNMDENHDLIDHVVAALFLEQPWLNRVCYLVKLVDAHTFKVYTFDP